MKQFYLNFLITILIGIFSAPLLSQTTLIDPAGAGGFELGATFGANGWSVSSGSNNPWFVGVPGAQDPPAPMNNNKAYVSSDAGATRIYDPALPCQNYFWRDVTVPAGETKIVLTFNWEQQGETSWDIVQVFSAPTSITPVGSNTHPGSGANTVPATIAGATYLTNTASAIGVQSVTAFLPASLAGTTFRLIFLWKSDTSVGTQPPAAIDNISLVSSVPGNYVSVATGDWTNPATWGTPDFPTPLDNATVSVGNTVTINALNLGANNLTVNGTCTFNATATTMIVNGNLTVNAGGIFTFFQGTTGKRLTLFGNLTNNGTIDLSVGLSSSGTGTNGVFNLTGSGVQTVSGTGTWTGNSIRNLLMTNTNTSIPNIIWNVNNIVVQHNLNLTGARVDLSGNTILSGSSLSTSPTLTVPSGTGFLNGIYGRWWTTGQTGSLFTAGADPTTTTSQYPFVNSSGQNRSMWIRRTSSTTTGNTAGYLRVQYNDISGVSTITSVDDGGYMINQQFNGNWAITKDAAYAYASGTHQIATVAPQAYFPINANSRLMYQSSVTGTQEAGTITPGAKRFGLSTTQLTGGNWYMGINSSDLPVTTVAVGTWDNPAIWSSGVVPTCNDATLVLHRVTVNSAGNVARGVIVGANGRLIISSGDLTVDACTPRADSRFDIGAGRFEMQGGTLTVRGSFRTLETTTGVFQQTGGDIIVDGNNGVLTESVASHIVDLWCTNASMLDLTGGTFTVVDPPLSTTTTNCAFKVFPYAGLNVSSGTGWQLNIGNGSVTNNGGHTNGYLLNLLGNSSAAFKIGNLQINTGIGGTNRFVNTSNNLPLTNLTVTSGEYRTGSTHFISGDIAVGVNGTLSWTGTITFSDWGGNAGLQGSTAQQITNNGTIRNSTTTTTANLFSLTMNNSGGLTLNNPLTMSGTLLMTKGIINTTATNTLRLGTITAAATLSASSVFANDTHINGPVLRTSGAATASNTFTNTTLFPTGKGGVYYPMWLSPTTTAPTIFTAEAFTDMPRTPGPGVSNLADNRWVISADLPANVTAAHVQLGDADIFSTNQILQAPTASGAYSGIVTGTAFTAGTPNTIRTNPNGSPIPSASYTGFFSYGDLVPCFAPSAQPTALTFSGVSSTSLIGRFTLASPAADGYLVVRYPAGATPVNPFDGTSYSPGGSLGTGTIAAVGAATTFNVTGLVASTTYDFYVYSYNAIGCGGGPVYLTSSPLFNTITTCGTVVNPITGLATSARTQTTFNIFWTASTTPNVSYRVDVASDVGFTNILQFDLDAGTGTTYQITGLMPSTTYHFRVRALDPVSGCFSTNVAAQNGTNCSATNTPYLENINGSLACLSIFSTGTGNNWGVAVAPAAPSGMTGNTGRIISSTAAATNNYFITRAVNLTGGQSYDFKFKYGNSTTTASLSMDLIYSQADMNGGITLANNVVMGTLSNINNIVSNTATFAFIPPTTGEYYLMFRAFGPIASVTSNLHVDDIEVFLTPPCASASGGTASSSVTGATCGNQNTTSLTASGYTYALGMTYQWEKSTDNTTWTNMGSVISHPAQPVAPVISDPFTVGNNYYRLRAVCENGPVTGYSTVIGPIVYSNPQPLTTTGGSRCGTGTVDLSCTVNGGDDARWYANPTGGAPIGSGTMFTTPSISTTTDYYVAAVTGGSNQAIIPGNTWNQYTSAGAYQTTGITGAAMILTVSQPTTLTSVDIFPSAIIGTNFTLEARLNTGSGTLMNSFTGVTTVTNGATPSNSQTLNLNWTLAPGIYHVGFTSTAGFTNPSCWRSGVFTHPVASWTIPGVIAVDYSLTPSYQYYLYNPIVFTGCEGTRVPVTATVTSPPALTLSSSAETICEASLTPTITITSNIADYDTYTWSPSTNVSGTPNTGYTFNPTTTTTYTLTGSQVNPPLCANTAQVVVTVNPRPTILSATATPATVNCGDNSQLDVSVSSGISAYAFANNTSPFSLLSGATPVVVSNNDDAISGALPIGFNFNLGGSTFSQFLMSTNGWITFDITATTATTNYSSLNGFVPHIIAAYSGDLNSTGNALSYQTTGSPGSQICKIQWTNTTEWSTTEVPDLSSFQIWLYEGTNVVEIRYGSFGVGTRTGAQSPSPQVGLRGVSTASTDVLSLGSSTNWAAPVAGNTSTTGMPATVSVLPDDGRMYTFTPKTFSYSWAPTTYLDNPNIRNPIAQNIGGSITYNAIVTDIATGCSRTSDNVEVTTTTNCSIGLALTAFIEGYFDGGTMVPVLLNSGVAGATASQADTIVVALHNNTAPYAKAYEFKGVLGTNGTLNCTFPGAANGGNYYIVVTGRNMLETWSASSMVFTATNTYNFSSDASQAFGGNMVSVGETWCFFSGDIDGNPADGNIDLIDYPVWETDYNNLEVGYFRTDLNGDGSVDLVDYPIWETNYNNLITVIKP